MAATPRNTTTFTLNVGTNSSSLFTPFNAKKMVEKMEGVEKVEVNPFQGRVVITGTVRPDKVIATLQHNLGIKAELLPTNSITLPPRSTTTTTFTLKVGTNSLFDVINIRMKVEKMEGVEKVETNPWKGKVVITGTIRPHKVIATLQHNLGIKAELLPPPLPALPRNNNGSNHVGQSSNNGVNPLQGDLNKVAQDVGQLRRMVPGLTGVKISNQIVSNSIEFTFNNSS